MASDITSVAPSAVLLVDKAAQQEKEKLIRQLQDPESVYRQKYGVGGFLTVKGLQEVSAEILYKIAKIDLHQANPDWLPNKLHEESMVQAQERLHFWLQTLAKRGKDNPEKAEKMAELKFDKLTFFNTPPPAPKHNLVPQRMTEVERVTRRPWFTSAAQYQPPLDDRTNQEDDDAYLMMTKPLDAATDAYAAVRAKQDDISVDEARKLSLSSDSQLPEAGRVVVWTGGQICCQLHDRVSCSFCHVWMNYTTIDEIAQKLSTEHINALLNALQQDGRPTLPIFAPRQRQIRDKVVVEQNPKDEAVLVFDKMTGVYLNYNNRSTHYNPWLGPFAYYSPEQDVQATGQAIVLAKQYERKDPGAKMVRVKLPSDYGWHICGPGSEEDSCGGITWLQGPGCNIPSKQHPSHHALYDRLMGTKRSILVKIAGQYVNRGQNLPAGLGVCETEKCVYAVHFASNSIYNGAGAYSREMLIPRHHFQKTFEYDEPVATMPYSARVARPRDKLSAELVALLAALRTVSGRFLKDYHANYYKEGLRASCNAIKQCEKVRVIVATDSEQLAEVMTHKITEDWERKVRLVTAEMWKDLEEGRKNGVSGTSHEAKCNSDAAKKVTSSKKKRKKAKKENVVPNDDPTGDANGQTDADHVDDAQGTTEEKVATVTEAITALQVTRAASKPASWDVPITIRPSYRSLDGNSKPSGMLLNSDGSPDWQEIISRYRDRSTRKAGVKEYLEQAIMEAESQLSALHCPPRMVKCLDMELVYVPRDKKREAEATKAIAARKAQLEAILKAAEAAKNERAIRSALEHLATAEKCQNRVEDPLADAVPVPYSAELVAIVREIGLLAGVGVEVVFWPLPTVAKAIAPAVAAAKEELVRQVKRQKEVLEEVQTNGSNGVE